MLLMELVWLQKYGHNVPRWTEQLVPQCKVPGGQVVAVLLAAVAQTLCLPAVQVPGAPAWVKHTHYGGTGIHYGARLLLWAATQSMESKRLVEWVAVPHGPFITGACQVPVTWFVGDFPQ